MLKRLFVLAMMLLAAAAAEGQWPQFGGNPRHTGSAALTAQPLVKVLADVIHDPFVPEEVSDSGDLFIHYPAPILDSDDVFMSRKEQAIVGPPFPIPMWGVHRLHWENGQLVDKWTTYSDWSPVPDRAGLWEPVFQPVLANGFIFAPAEGGTLLQIDRSDGTIIRRINPFPTQDSQIFVSGAPAVDPSGNIFYTAFRLQSSNPWQNDVTGAWLVRVKADLSTSIVPYSTLVPNAPRANDLCTYQFSGSTRVPPSPNAVPPSIPCGSQRPGLNSAPAIAPDGTIYIVSRAHFNEYWSYVVAVNADLTPKWATSLRNRFHDGCNVFLPANGTPGGCPDGTTTGVDPWENQPGSGRVVDNSTASPVVAPDGSVIYGSYTFYNNDQGHLVHIAADGTYLDHAYPFGWDTTPAIWQHGNTYSLITKENRYDLGVIPNPAFFVTQLDPVFHVEWQYRNPSMTSCRDNNCVDEESGFEWCVNAPAVDANGTVYANAEDGILYAIRQGGVLLDRTALAGPLGAAYTPIAIDAQGRVYAQTGGHLFAVGGVLARKRVAR